MKTKKVNSLLIVWKATTALSVEFPLGVRCGDRQSHRLGELHRWESPDRIRIEEQFVS